MAARTDEQIVISWRAGGEPRGLKRSAPGRAGLVRGAKLEGLALADHGAAAILPASHLYIEKLGELRSPVLP